MRQRIVGALVVLITVWGALAQIAPDLFQLRGRAVLGWLWNPMLIWLALPLAVAWFAWRLQRLSSEWERNRTAQKSADTDVRTKLSALETRLLENVNKTGSTINDRVRGVEAHVGDLNHRLASLAEFVRPISKMQVDIFGLKLKTGIVQVPSEKEVDPSEVIFTDADTGRKWRFGEISRLSEAEKDRLKATRPDVFKAWRARLFRDVIVPPEYLNLCEDSDESYPCRTGGGTIQRFTKAEIDELMEKNPDAYLKLRDLNPNLERWRDDAL